MKKLILLFLLTFSYVCLKGQIVSYKDAEDFVIRWIEAKTEPGSVSINKIEKLEDKGNLPYCYLIELQPEGFIIISGNKSVNPILGYSLENTINPDLLPPPIKSFLEKFKDRIKGLEDKNKTINSGWNLIKSEIKSASSEIAPLIKTQWSQNYPYNSMCPGNAPAGCIAVAMAQLMNYYKYPYHGLQDNSYLSAYYGITLSADFKNTFYDWQSMATVATDINPAISQLIYHTGISVNMDYLPSLSTASTSQIAEAFINNFGYDSNSKEVLTTDQDTKTWKKLLMDELDLSHPIIYGGSTDINFDESHLFILDGYDSDTLFHINWGWGGSADGYYNLEEIQWQYRQRAFLNVFPPPLRADFEVDTLYGLASFPVQFKDFSLFRTTAITSWKWDFNNDGVTDSENSNPVYTFNSMGLYSVKLIVSNGQDTDTLIKKDLITAVCPVIPKYVSINGNDYTGTGTESRPFNTIQHAIDLSFNNKDTIIVGNGKFLENISFKGKNILVSSRYILSKNHSDILNTIIDGNKNGSVVVFESGEDSEAKLVGFTLQNGSGDYVHPSWVAGDRKDNIGGCIRCENSSSPTLRYLIIKDNSAESVGSAIYAADNSDIHLNNCIVSNNKGRATLFLHSSDILIDSTYILNNNGGGIYFSNGTKSLINRSIIAGNTDLFSDIGSAIHYDYGSKGLITNSIIYNNHDPYNPWPDSGYAPGALYLHVSNVTVCNSIIYENTPNEIIFSPSINCGPNSLTISHTDLIGGQNAVIKNNNGTVNWLDGNSDFLPSFLDASKFDFRVNDYCTSIDAGIRYLVYNQETIVNIPPSDFSGTNPDLGVFESSSAKTTIEKLIPLVSDLPTSIIDKDDRIKNSQHGGYCYPNPFNPEYQHAVIKFQPVTSEKYILRISDLNGKIIKLINSEDVNGSREIIFYWDGTNNFNNKVEKGIYLYSIESRSGNRFTGKIMVL